MRAPHSFRLKARRGRSRLWRRLARPESLCFALAALLSFLAALAVPAYYALAAASLVAWARSVS